MMQDDELSMEEWLQTPRGQQHLRLQALADEREEERLARRREQNKEYKKRYRGDVRERQRRYDRREDNKLRKREYHYEKKYSITLDDYHVMLELQGGKCAICGTDKPTGKWGMWCVDHSHETGRVRGLLCNTCNSRLSILENEEFVEAAKVYLEKYR